MTVARTSGRPPSINTCLLLMDRHAMFQNIREHSHRVARVAEVLWGKLSRHVPLDNLPSRDLLLAGALLHDIAKSQCLQSGSNHIEEGARICRNLGFSDIAEIIAEHARLPNYEKKRWQKGIFLAKEFVFYADKRVLHTEVVDLDTRLAYILERYGKNDQARHHIIKASFANCMLLEQWFCRFAGCNTQELLLNLNMDPLS